ncbi:MAG: AAA family ATPase [Mariprofundales bacterium]
MPRKSMLELQQQLGLVLADKDKALQQIMACLLCGGHILIEDLPGMGKTTIAHGLAASMHTDFGRIQFTADLLPADIIGVEIYHPGKESFSFHPGAIFHHIVLADEINRATPKAQSALLEAMAEGQVSIDRKTHKLPQPFLVIATQNPLDQAGTFPLPESQLDRFFMRIHLGYPDRDAERRILLGEVGQDHLQNLTVISSLLDWQQAKDAVAAMPVSNNLINYLLDLLTCSRNGQWLRSGVSPRAAKDVLAAAKAIAWLANRSYVRAADIQQIWLPCLQHRVQADGDPVSALLGILDDTPVPA